MKTPPDARRILLVQALRAFAYGLGSVLIGVTLADLGLSGVQVGLVLGALVAGTALVSIVLARSGDRIGRRRWYLALLVTMGLAGTVFALTGSVWLMRQESDERQVGTLPRLLVSELERHRVGAADDRQVLGKICVDPLVHRAQRAEELVDIRGTEPLPPPRLDLAGKRGPDRRGTFSG